MSAKSRLRQALSTIDDAKTKLRRTLNNRDTPSDISQNIRQAISELEGAESAIQIAMRDVE